VAVPEGVIFQDVSPIEDLTIRLRYGIGVHEKPVHLIYFGPVIARRPWPDYRVEVLGIDLRTLPLGVEGPIFPLTGWEVQSYGRISSIRQGSGVRGAGWAREVYP